MRDALGLRLSAKQVSPKVAAFDDCLRPLFPRGEKSMRGFSF